ncbi:hypothetical protein IJJ05_02380 [Candidatus Saccharibacteria bacterium]|nr:hypothetical protein [Candidatus Saccharibacteria bacterium]
MEPSEMMTEKIIKRLLGILPEEAEDDFQNWLSQPSDEGLDQLLSKYNIDADKIAREAILEGEDA